MQKHALQTIRLGRRAVVVVSRGAAVFVFTLGVFSLLLHFSDYDFGLDVLPFHDPAGAVATKHPGLMTPSAALSFAITGVALWLAGVRRVAASDRRLVLLWQGCLLVVGLLAFVVLVGYLYGVVPLAGWPHFTPMAAHTAGAFLLLSLGGLWLRPQEGFMPLISSRAAGSRVARRLLLPVVAVPLTLGWLRELGESAGMYGQAVGISVMVISNVILQVTLVAFTASWLNRADASRRRAQEEIRQLNENLEGLVRERTTALSDSEARLRAIVKTAKDPVVMMDSRGRIEMWNEAAVEVLGYSRDEALGQPLHELLAPLPYQEQALRALPAWRSFGTGTIVGTTRELPALRKDGRQIAVELSVSSIFVNQEWHAVGILRDITARKIAEAEIGAHNEELERRVRERTAQLEDSNRELEAFSYSVSHDLRAPLRHIDGFIKLLAERERGRLDETSARHMRRISDAAVKLGALVDDLLAFSRTGRSELQAQRVDLNPLLSEVRQEVSEGVAGRVIHWRLDPLPSVMGDRVLLRQLWINLLSNAVKYTRDRAEAHIEVFRTEAPNGDPGAAEVVVAVRDDGVGFDPAYTDKLFGVFQRLHRDEEFPGTGIGLATVRRIADRHGGRVWAEGEVDRGATFYVALPAAHEGAGAERAGEASAEPPASTEDGSAGACRPGNELNS